MNKNYFVFEGADGIGKTTLAKQFANHIGARFTYEPFGHTKTTSTLRQIALTHDIHPVAREYILLGNRVEGYQDVQHWLDNGEKVVSDRSFLSGMVYAHIEGIPFKHWWAMAEKLRLCRGWNQPHIILCSNSKFKTKDDPNDRYDTRPDSFHQDVANTFHRALCYLGSLSHTIESIDYLMFDIKFHKSPEENLERLLEKMAKDWPQTDLFADTK